jgi:hypothetical protein
MSKMDTLKEFECCICMDKTDDLGQSIYPTSELADPYIGQNHLYEEWCCKKCYADLIHEKLLDKYSEDSA